MSEFVRNAAAILFAVVFVLGLVGVVSRKSDVLLGCAAILTGVAGVIVALGGRVG